MDGEPAALGARAFDVLLTLVERAGDLVTKNELLERVWSGLVVEEANLTVQVSSLRKVLGGELIVTIPGRGYRFTGRVDTVASPGARSSQPAQPGPTPPSALAPPALPDSQLVGRRSELDAAHVMLARPGVVTLVGPAGVGKTSLARALAAGRAGGAVWVDLAPLTEETQVLAALARALGQPTPDQPAALLLAIDMRLVVLDNAEHLVDAVAALTVAILNAAPGQPLLATCQLPLSVPGERVLRVDPLALGDEPEAGALALFIDRARAADHRFAPSPANLPLLSTICGQLDGLPLALEMAAARVPTLGLSALHDALAQRFGVLTRGARTASARHQTLHAALDWSHGLLQADEQRLFRALGTFAGGFTLDLAVAVAVDEAHDRWAVIETLATLVDRSLVVTDAADPPRYRLLETMRAYALQQLKRAGEHQALHLRHAQALLGLFDPAAAVYAADAQRALAAAEYDNAREAIAWSTPHAPALAVRLAHQVSRALNFTALRVDTLRWLEASEPAVAHESVSVEFRVDWWIERARQLRASYRPEARSAVERARDISVAAGYRYGVFMADVLLLMSGELTAERLHELRAELEQLDAAHPEWRPRSTMQVHRALAWAFDQLGDVESELRHRLAECEAARQSDLQASADSAETNVVTALIKLERFEEALARSQRLLARLADEDSGNAVYAWAGHIGALVGLQQHDGVRAAARRFWALVQRFRFPYLASKWAVMLNAEGRHEDAARIVGFVHQATEAGCGPMPAFSRAEIARVEAVARAAIGDERWVRGVEQGRGFDEARAFACVGAAP